MTMSIGTTFNYEIPLHDQLPMIREAGFTHISLGGGNLDHSRYLDQDGQKLLRRFLAKSGVKVCSLHTPFKDGYDISSTEPEIAVRTLAIFRQCIDAALALKAQTLIFHPCPQPVRQVKERKVILADQVLALLDFLGPRDLKLAIENLSTDPANRVLAYSLERIVNRKYGLCYDTSHDNLVERPTEILKQFADRLVATHISDNRGRRDDHILPFEGCYRWDKFSRIFSTIKYEGLFLLEVEMNRSAFTKPQQFLSEAFARGERLLRESGKL